MAATALIEALARRGAAFERIPHRHTETAAAEARAVGVPADETAKTVIVRAGDRFVRAVVPASRRVDVARLAGVLGAGTVALVTEPELVGAYPEFELGAVPPLDPTDADEVVIDSHLAAQEHVVFDAGTHEESLRMRTADLVAAARATVADICEGGGGR
jgi:Ala-tRNA(Pro) deacylase